MKSGALIGIFKGEGDYNVWKSIKYQAEWELDCQGIKCYEDLQKIKGFQEFNELTQKYNRFYGHEEDYDTIYVASEFHSPWVNSEGKVCWDYKKGKHFHLFHSNFPLVDYSFIKNFTKETITIKCRNGVFALPSGEVMIAEFNKCLNNKKNAEKYGIVKLERGETSRELAVTTEWCPYCEEDVEIPSIGMTQCKCGKWLIPCSMCNMENADCDNCISAKIAEERNSPKVGF